MPRPRRPSSSTPELHLPAGALDALDESGYAYVPGAIGRHLCEAIVREWETAPWERAEELVGRVRQRADVVVVPLPEGQRTATASLVDAFCTCYEAARRASTPFRPDEVTLMRYRTTGDGIGAHRDHARYRSVIFVASLTGVGRFTVVNDRAGTDVRDEWLVQPGDVVLLAAGAATDRRPLHVARTIRAPRVSLALRMSRDDEPELETPVHSRFHGRAGSGA